MCAGAEVVVVGGGNSAGQAAVFMATQARKVYLLIRGNDLHKNQFVGEYVRTYAAFNRRPAFLRLLKVIKACKMI